VKDCGSDDGAGRSGEGGTSGRHLKEDQTEREDVGSRVDLVAAQLLRRHVGERADRGAFAGQHRRRGGRQGDGVLTSHPRRGLGDAEVEQLRTPCREKDVRGFDVAMNDPGAVGGGERVGQRNRGVEQDGHLQRALPQTLFERIALEELHDDERLLLRGFADVINRADVGMVQRGDRPGFALKTLACQVGAGEPRRQHLDGDLAVEAGVAGAVDLAHPTFAKLGKDLVWTDRLPDHKQGLSMATVETTSDGSRRVPADRAMSTAEAASLTANSILSP
jgi:hypothetical protein